MTNEELVVAWQQSGDERLFDDILARYRGMINRFAIRMHRRYRLSLDECEQECTVGVFRAACEFRAEAGVLFLTYAWRCLENVASELGRAVSRSLRAPCGTVLRGRRRALPLPVVTSTSLPLPADVERHNEPDTEAEDAEYARWLLSWLSDRDREVMVAMCEGSTMREQAAVAGIRPQSIHQLTQRSLRRMLDYAGRPCDKASVRRAASRFALARR